MVTHGSVRLQAHKRIYALRISAGNLGAPPLASY